MAQSSRFWTTDGASGDAPVEGYTADQFAAFIKKAFGNGVMSTIANELAISGATSPLVVATGACFGAGYFYENTANVDVVIASPVIDTTGFRIVIRFVWATPEGRIYLNMSADGVSSPPVPVENEGTTWDVTLCTGTITVAGVITFDESVKVWSEYSNRIATDMIKDEAVTTTKIGPLAVVESKIAAGAVTTTKIGPLAVVESKIAAGAVTNLKLGDLAVSWNKIEERAVIEGKIGTDAVTVTKISALAVTNAKIGTGAVDNIKIGNRVPKLTKRTGGSATQWDSPGTTQRDVIAVSIVTGCFSFPMAYEQESKSITVTFPVTFIYNPVVFLQLSEDLIQQYAASLLANTITTTTFKCMYRSPGPTVRTVVVFYMAIGQL